MNEPAAPYILTNQNSPAFWLIDNLWMPLAGSYLTNGNVCLIEQVCGTGIGGPCTHAHPFDEGLYVIEGQCTFHAGGKTVKAGPGSFVSIPRLVEHSFTVDAPHSRLLNFYTPGGFEMLLMSIATPAADRKPPEPNSLPMPPRWMVEECSREFGQIPVLGLPFADPPTQDNMATRPSNVNPVPPYGIAVKDAPAYWSQGILWTILASAEQTGGSYSMLEELCSLNSGPPPHTHEQDEMLYVLEGEITLIAGSLKTAAKAGTLAYIPAKCVHSFRVDAHETKLLNFYFPGGFERILTEFATPAASRTLPPPEVRDTTTPEQMKALFQRVGMNPVALPDSLRQSQQPVDPLGRLNDAQHTVSRELLTSTDRVHGFKGSGGPDPLDAIRDEAEQAGYTVEGFAPTSKAAGQLREDRSEHASELPCSAKGIRPCQ